MDYLSTVLFTGGGSFFVGLVIGNAIEKVIKVHPVILGILFAIMAYFDYSNSISVNLEKCESSLTVCRGPDVSPISNVRYYFVKWL
jgi:uncharacterized membrane protein (Fun14 family)